MTPRKRRRLTALVLILLGIGTATALALNAFQDALVFFNSPSDLAAKPPPPGQRLRLGGLVEEGSVKRDGQIVTFRVTDKAAAVPVTYGGPLPDLFREGQGVVTEGYFDGGIFRAREVLAKHDETYMPREVADALKKSGHWKERP